MENSIKYYKESEQNYYKYMDNATTEVEKYKKIINKALEYIEKEFKVDIDELIDILKGENNE